VIDVETLQHEWELDRLVDLCERARPKRVLEIGSWEGGTLRRWLAFSPLRLAVVDDEMRGANLWRAWAAVAGTHLHLIEGKSQDQGVIAAAVEHGPYDWIFLDADHRYEAGKADWAAYEPLIAPGGLFAMHDIRDYEHGNLSALWQEIRRGRRSLEILDLSVEEPWGGIGVVWN